MIDRNMPEPGWQTRTLGALVQVVAHDLGVVEVRVHGSVAELEASRLDRWSDLDVVIVVGNQSTADWLFPDPRWLAALGEVWALDADRGDDHAILRVVLGDLRRLDVRLLPASWPVEVRPGQVVYARQPGLRQETPSGSTRDAVVVFAAPADDPDPMRALHGRFRFDAVLAVVKVARGDVLIAGHLALGLVRHLLVAAMLLRDRDAGNTHHRYGGSHWDSWASSLNQIEWPCTTPQIIGCIRTTMHHFTGLLTDWEPASVADDAPLHILLDIVEQTTE